MSKKLKIGLFGYGVVGHGIYEILSKGLGFDVEIVKICVKNPDKKRDLPMDRFTFDRKEIIDNSEVSLIVEVINDAEAAY